MEKPQQDAMGNNKYQRVMLAARRARELAEGINLTPEMEGTKITSTAMDELDKGMLKNERAEKEEKADDAE